VKLISIVFVVAACGGGPKKPAPEPINNEVKTEPAPTKPATAGQAKVITKTAQGGIVELQGDRGVAMLDANEQMNAHCGVGNYTITQEGEEAVGADSAGSEVRTATAWRVYYACNK